jgi:hypothetical protein
MAFCADMGFLTGDTSGTVVVRKMIAPYPAVLKVVADLL